MRTILKEMNGQPISSQNTVTALYRARYGEAPDAKKVENIATQIKIRIVDPTKSVQELSYHILALVIIIINECCK